jgi:predicted metalloprotease
MRWMGRRQSGNIEDRRGQGGGRRMAMGGGIGTVVIILVAMALGVDPRALFQGGGPAQPQQRQGQRVADPQEERLKEFVAVVLADTEEVWHEQFRRMGKNYREPKLVLFSGSVESACGYASAAVGPFYCPADEKVYVDLSFFDELDQRLGAPGDFAQAYVIAHEVGHHVQNLLGISEWVQSQRRQLSETEYNQLSVRLELQADFLAGVWAHYAQAKFKVLEPGDLEEAFQATQAIGDDRLQKRSQGFVVPDSFTHGSSEQRLRWFRRGFETGDMSQGDTFRAKDL